MVDLTEFHLPPGPKCAKPSKELFGLRVVYCQELRAIGMKVRDIAERLNIQARKVPWYAEPAGYSAILFPIPWMVVDPSPVNDRPVLYDEFGKPERDSTIIWLKLFLEHLTAEGGAEKSLDYEARTALYRKTNRLHRRMWEDFPDLNDDVPHMPPQGHLVQAPRLRQVVPRRARRMTRR